MRVGVVGAGKWGQNIVRTLHELGHLAGVADASEVSRATVGEKYPGTPVFSSLDDLLDLGLDAVAIATPAPSHGAIAKQVLEAGLHCFVDKPFTLESGEAESLCKLADEKGLTLMVGHLLIYQPAIDFIKKSVEVGMVGKVLCLNHERLNLGRARDVENVLWSLGVHDIAVALFLAGAAPIDSGMTGFASITPGVEDDTRLWMKFENGLLVHIHNSWLWPERRRALTVIGTKGMLVYDELAQTVTLHNKSIASGSLDITDDGTELVYEGAGQPLTLEMEHFVACCESGEKPKTDGWSGLDVVRVMEHVSPVQVKV